MMCRIKPLGLAVLLLCLAAPGFAQPLVHPRSVSGDARLATLLEAGPAPAPLDTDTTLRYFDYQNGSFFFDIEPERPAVGTFFEAPFDGTVDEVRFFLLEGSFSSGEALGVAGTGSLRIKMIPAEEVITPASPGVDSLDVPFSELEASTLPFNNEFDLSGRAFEVTEGAEYFFQFSLVDASADAALSFVFDGGSADTTDTRYFHYGDARTFVYVRTDTLDSYRAFKGLCEECFFPNVIMEVGLNETPPPPPPPRAEAFIQFVHNVPDADSVDVYVGDSLVVDDLKFRQATMLRKLPVGEQAIDVVAGGAKGNDAPLFSTTVELADDQALVAVVLGSAVQQTLGVVLADPDAGMDGESSVPILFVHGGLNAGSVDVQLLGEPPVLVADDLAFGQVAGPVGVPAELAELAVTIVDDGTLVDVYKLALSGGGGITGKRSMLVVASGILGDEGMPFTLFAVDQRGEVSVAGVCPSTFCVSTATEEEAVPGTYALHANYPNPFNPVTTIRFDLATPGFTTLAIYDVLGRRVATLVAEDLHAGRHAATFDAAGLPSGPYLYRLTSGTYTGQRMLTLVK